MEAVHQAVDLETRCAVNARPYTPEVLAQTRLEDHHVAAVADGVGCG